MILFITLLAFIPSSQALTPKDWEGLWKWELSANKNGEIAISKCSKEGCDFTITTLYAKDGDIPATCIDEGQFKFTKATYGIRKLDGVGTDKKTKCELRFTLNPKAQTIDAKIFPDTSCICDASGQLGGPFKSTKSGAQKNLQKNSKSKKR